MPEAKATAVSGPVLRSLYRQLIKEVSALDSTPVAKVLLPIEIKLVTALGLSNQLYAPGTTNYKELLRKAFRQPTQDLSTSVGFDTLARLKAHHKLMSESMTKIVKDNDPLTKALEKAHPPTHEALPFKPKPPSASPAIDSLQAALDKSTNERTKTIFGKALVKREKGSSIFPGLGLIAHPLSSAHADRRVMMIVEKNSQVTTGLVLDMIYSYPLSNGNPMFPEVFWGHEVLNGGYCHVDFTMPPTANVSILHTLPPPVKTEAQHHSWLRWATSAKIDPDRPNEHHELLCKPLIRGGTSPQGVVHPTLYYSKVEALPYLSALCPGEERSKLRVYWGSMRWSTSQLVHEIEDGHWIPVELSPMFFSAYPVLPPLQQAVGQPVLVPRFPTEQGLADSKAQREHHLGVDIAPPQTFPPDQPQCRREALWDQILFSLGGEYRSLVGCSNPFSNPKDSGRQLPALSDDVVRLLAAIDSAGSVGGDDDDDDDDSGAGGPGSPTPPPPA